MNEKSVTSYELILENCETIILSNTDLIEAKFTGLNKHIDIWQSENQVLRKESQKLLYSFLMQKILKLDELLSLMKSIMLIKE